MNSLYQHGLAAAEIPTHEVTAAEAEQARTLLRSAENGLVAATQGLSERQWRYEPAPGQWSIASILEHCALVQQAVIGPIREQLAAAPLAPNPDGAAVDQVLLKKVEDRSIKAEAPEFLQPTGGLSESAAWQILRGSNMEILDWLETAVDLRQRCIPGPPAMALSQGRYEWMDGYQWILAAAGHLARHTGQILEIRNSSSFPAA